MDDILPPKRPAKVEPKPEPPKESAPPTAAIEPLDEPIVLDDEPKTPPKKEPAELGRLARLKKHWRGWSKNKRFAILSAAFLVFCALVLGIYFFTQPSSNPSLAITKHKAKSNTVPSPLSGVQVAPNLAARPVTGIMIENSTDARPQSGLQDAGVVYEAVAEAGITRFLALFQDTSPQYIGPVRSLRPYFIDFAAPFSASIVHVGGSPDALSEVTSGGFRNLDQFYNGDYFNRVSTHAAPHNVYTSFDQLDKLEASKGYTSSTFTPWLRKKDAKLKTPTAGSIDFAISSNDYHVHYAYDAKSNAYNRNEGGAPHMDLVSANDGSGVQLKPKVVVALVMPLSQGALDASGAYYSNYADSGSGIAYVFQDGGVTQGTWTKDGTQGQLQLTDSAGHALALNAGQTWLTLVNSTSQVSYTP